MTNEFLMALGINGLVAALMYKYMNQNLKQLQIERISSKEERSSNDKKSKEERDSNDKNIDKFVALINKQLENTDKDNRIVFEKFDKLIDVLNDLTSKDIQNNVIFSKALEDIKMLHDSQVSLLKNFEDIINAIDIRTKLCPNINKLIKGENKV